MNPDLRAPQHGLSHVKGLTEPRLSEWTIPQWLDFTATRRPLQTACVFREAGLRWTWAQLREQSRRLAAGLLKLGFQPGERLGIWSPNRPEWILAQYASAHIGVVLVNINPAYRLAELEYALNAVQCKGLISAAAFKTSAYLEMLQQLAPELAQHAPGALQAQRLPHLRTVIRMGTEASAGMFNVDAVMALADSASLQQVQRIFWARQEIQHGISS